MARKSSQRLQVLLKLAEMKEQAAVRQLAAAIERAHQAQQQGQRLEDYEQDYIDRYRGLQGQPIGLRALSNFSGFFRQLERAQEQQERAIAQREREQEKARRTWVDLHARRRLLDKVRERRLLAETLATEKKLQRDIDDRAARKPSGDRD